MSRVKISVLELHAAISLKDLILIKRIDRNIPDASSAKRTVDAPGIRPREVQANRVGEHIPDFNGYALLVNTTVIDVRVNQIGVQSELTGVLIPSPDLPVVLRL